MAKTHRVWVCTRCGHSEPKWLGQCPSCGEWNTLEEHAAHRSAGGPSARRDGGEGRGAPFAPGTPLSAPLADVDAAASSRVPTGIGELDRALGGGLVPGSSVLVGGEPGIGKSTLMLQLAGALESVLYVGAEESAAQVRRRADRLGVHPGGIHLLDRADLAATLAELERLRPRVLILDSLQTVIAGEAGAVPGTVNQIKLIAHEVGEWARRTGGVALLVAHVTKEGQIAGPKVIEHMVDAVLLFEQSESELRVLRATKNRFGAIEEVGLFTMGPRGLAELSDPGRAFLSGVERSRPAGVVAAPCYEGSRVIMVEIQALVVPAKGSVSRISSDRIDNRRVSRVAAVLEKHVGLRMSDQDIYVNVAGGMRIHDVAIDVPLGLALWSARTDLAIPGRRAATGELSLAGEVRPISHRDARAKSAIDLGFERVVGPPQDGAEAAWFGVTTIRDAVAAAAEGATEKGAATR